MPENVREIKKILKLPEVNRLFGNPKPFRRPVQAKQQPADLQTVPNPLTKPKMTENGRKWGEIKKNPETPKGVLLHFAG